ncbi:hypothetical protein MHK_009940 [Candidatus Magnetomorum sp. HK-1]|nr:hypothetical protein MHK_009940 [Candidatus Magnetomorum sp. HK-1]
MTEFQIYGSFEIPFDKKERKVLTEKFWSMYNQYYNCIGCYIYSITIKKTVSNVSKYSKKIEIKYHHIPYYIGTTISSFGTECFSKKNLKFLNEPLSKNSRYSPSLFFIIPNEFKKESKDMKELKTFLIQAGRIVNPVFTDLNGELPVWSIKGIINPDPCKKVRKIKEADTFKKMMGLTLSEKFS